MFGTLCALIYTSAAPHKTMHAAGEKQKIITRQKTATADKSTADAKVYPSRLDSALVSKIDLPIRDAPRGDAKILGRAVYGSRVEVLGQDGRWAQVLAIGQNAAGWVEKAGLNF
ncbi:SH3 domain-containing protein [Methylocystis iwaonis]|uniref:SH3 domain-containing protein n=1 Tax=Methylocystis iwaonis TaxID=2885079 RepID=UPI002493B134|nr:SH3 domain-containing protein [Methylocystis iwaonis]